LIAILTGVRRDGGRKIFPSGAMLSDFAEERLSASRKLSMGRSAWRI
jgi:hypothetical protein